MSIEKFFNTTVIYEKYISAIDEMGQEVKTWSVSTFTIGDLQGRSGNRNIAEYQEKAIKTERFYCKVVDIQSTGRLVFSTSAFTYLGNSSGTTVLTSTIAGAMYFTNSSYTTYSLGTYAYNNGTTWVINNVYYRDILYANHNLRKHHLQIDLKVDYANRT